jgi:hypothetical protein
LDGATSEVSEGTFMVKPHTFGFLSPKMPEIIPRIRNIKRININMRNGFIIE